jgi:nucleoporin SEH1
MIYYKRDGQSNFSLYSNNFKGGHNQTVNDVAWAPLAGRSFHMIASCSKDGTIIVWKVVCRDILSGDSGFFKEPIIEQMAKLDAHKREVWRLSWNLLGTCFASSGDDGTVRIWKKSIKKFSQIACLQSKA